MGDTSTRWAGGREEAGKRGRQHAASTNDPFAVPTSYRTRNGDAGRCDGGEAVRGETALTRDPCERTATSKDVNVLLTTRDPQRHEAHNEFVRRVDPFGASIRSTLSAGL